MTRGRRKIDDFWRERVRLLYENEPRQSSARIHAQLQAEGEAINKYDYPSEKTVRNIIAEQKLAPDETRQEYRTVRWPESFGKPDLPWESGALVLALVRSDDQPVTVRTAKWFWRLFLATAGTLPFDECSRYARHMAAAEAVDSEPTWRDIERNLLHPDSPKVTTMKPLSRSKLKVLEEEGVLPKGSAEYIRSSFPVERDDDGR